VQAEVIRIIDLVVILKDQDGGVIVRELQELDPTRSASWTRCKWKSRA